MYGAYHMYYWVTMYYIEAKDMFSLKYDKEHSEVQFGFLSRLVLLTELAWYF
jgi:hypothetical protein